MKEKNSRKKMDPRVTFEPPINVKPIAIEPSPEVKPAPANDTDSADDTDSPQEIRQLTLPGFPPDVPPTKVGRPITKQKKAVYEEQNKQEEDEVREKRTKKRSETKQDLQEEDEVREKRTKKRSETKQDLQEQEKQQEHDEEDVDQVRERRTKKRKDRKEDLQEVDKQEDHNEEDDNQVQEKRTKKRNIKKDLQEEKMQQEHEVQEIRSMRRNEPRITRKKKQQMQEEENKDEDDEEDDVTFIGSKKRKQSTSPITKGKKEKVEKQEEQEDDVTVLDGKPSRVQYRSTLASIVSLLHNVKFTENQTAEIQKSPFATMLLAITENNLGEQFVKKYDNNILSVVQTYQRYEGKFNLGKKSVALTHDEIALIFGITSGNTKIRVFIQKRKPNSNFVNRNFQGTTTMAYSLMRTRITSLIESTSKLKKKKKGVEDESTKDLARLLTLYVLGTVFFKTTGPSLNWAYVPFVENLEECSTFAWSRYITDYLINELDSKYTNPWAVGGCTVALLYWLCEHAKIMEAVEPHIPRFMKWNVNELDAKLAETPVNSFSPEMVIDSELQSTDEERRLYTFLSTDETEAKHPETTVDEETVCDQVPEQNLQILISELRKQIHLLESENKKLKDEIAEREIREQQKDNNIGRLLHLVDKLRWRLERYGKEAAAYEEIEKENMSTKFEAMVLQEKVVQAEVEVMTLLAEKDCDKENIEAVLDELDNMAVHCISQEFSHKKIVEDITNENVNLNVEISSMLIEKDLAEEKIEEVIEQLDDMTAHCASQEYRDKKKIEEMEEKIQKISEKVVERNVREEFASPIGIPNQIVIEEDSESPPGNPYEFRMATDEDIEKTITAAVSIIDKQEENDMKKKRLRAERVVEPSSMTKRVRERDDRVEKKKEGYFYERRTKRAQQAKAAQVENDSLRFETTTLDAFLSQEDKEKLNMLSNLLKDKKLPFWMDHNTQDAVSLQDAIDILNEGDVENTLLDGFTSILAKDERKPMNVVYFKSVLWSLLKDDKNQIRDLFLDDKLREVNEKLDLFHYLVFPINSSGGIRAKDKNPYHWNLLVLDIPHGYWRHYNSIKPSRNDQDPYLKDAKLMAEYISNFMQKLNIQKIEPTFRLLKSTSETIFGAKEKNEVVIVSEKTPQQKRGSVDCGIIVCYIIEKLVNAEPVPENLSDVEINEFRVALLRRFLNDGHRSITPEVWKDRQEAEQMLQKLPTEGDAREADK